MQPQSSLVVTSIVLRHPSCSRYSRQVRAQGRYVDSEVDQLRQSIARLETEKTALAERVEEEGAERVTVVSSISHERDFLLRQVCVGRQKGGDWASFFRVIVVRDVLACIVG